MKLPDALRILEGMADQSRLLLLNALRAKPQCVEELAACLNLSSSTVSFHLKKLEISGLVAKERQQYYSVFQLNLDALRFSLLDLLEFENPGKKGQDERERQNRQKVLRTFFRGKTLLRMPAQQKKKTIILEELRHLFREDRRYPETEVNQILKEVHPDYCLLRRLMVDEGFMGRNQGMYWLNPASHLATETENPERKQRMEPTTERKNMSRKALIRAYKETPIPAGVLQIKNLENGKRLVVGSMNLPGAFNKHEFQLGMGGHPCKELQKDWKKLGPGSFSFEILETAKLPGDGSPVSPENVKDLEKQWLKKLQPFGDKGYNEKPRSS